MATETIVKSTCEMCNQGCGVLIHLKDGKPVKVEGDPKDPVSAGAICVKGAASLEYLDNPLRLKFPLKRTGERGEGKWQKVSWDEALGIVSSQLVRAKEKYGAESVVFIRGGAKGYQDTYLARFSNVFGTPNVASMATQCFVARNSSSSLTCGFMALPDYEFPPALIMMWAVNSRNTAIGEWKRANDALKKGSRLVVIDPWQTEFAKLAQLWVKPRPCTDLALALGMMNVIINEELYDKEFVQNWTTGFDKLKEHVQTYPPEKVAEITWVPVETIKQVARLYAGAKPACLAWGNGIDNNINNFQAGRALSILRAITGNLGRPGGDIDWSPSGILPKSSSELNAQSALPPELRGKRLNAADNLLPIFFYSLPQSIVKAAITGEPYAIKAIFIQGASILHTYPQAGETLQALKSLDFLAVSDFFMTPTAELADIVLPAATYLEIDSLHEGEYVHAANVIQKVAQVGESRSDYQIYAGLADKMGLTSYFPANEKEMMDHILKPAGLTFEEFKKIGSISGTKQYRDHEKAGFSTPSKKVEIYSSKLADWGFDPLPVYVEPPESPLSEPELAKEFPLVMTNRKLPQFQHSRERQIASLRRSRPEPVAHIHSETAGKLGIKEGDTVYIETRRGKIKQRANLVSVIDPRVVIVDFGWWFPERDARDLHGWAEANINILTCNKPPFSKEMGSGTLRGILCKVYRAK
jgi:anaerobic selenocysteine-containing dehydrogenase